MSDSILNQLSTTEKLAVVVSSSALAGLALLVCLNLTITQSYSDFVVGSIAWRAETKLQDLIATPIFISVLFLSVSFLMFQLVKQKQQFGSAYSIKLSDQLIWGSLPAIASIFSLNLGTGVDHNLLYLSAAGIGFIAISPSYNSFNRINISPEVLGHRAFSIILIVLMSLELALVRGREPATLVGDINLDHYVLATYVIIGFGLISGLLNSIRRPEQLTHFLAKTIR